MYEKKRQLCTQYCYKTTYRKTFYDLMEYQGINDTKSYLKRAWKNTNSQPQLKSFSNCKESKIPHVDFSPTGYKGH